MPNTHKKKLADIQFPTIATVMDQLLRLGNEQQAIDFLQNIETHFVISRYQINEENKRHSVILWIKDYDVTPEEDAKGYIGNFAAITYKAVGKKLTLYPTKIFLDLKQHPQRKYINTQKHPNWGHPILKAIKKKKTYKTIEAAHADLARVHEQFPTASIPTKRCLYVMVFSRAEDTKKPIQKYVLEPKALPEGGYYIAVTLNEGKRPKKPESKKVIPKIPKTSEDVKAPQGKFTSKEALRRSKKRK